MKVLKLCMPYLLQKKYEIILYIILGILINVIAVIIPYTNGGLIDSLVYSDSIHKLRNYCILIICLTLIRLVLDYQCSMLYARVQSVLSFNMSQDVINHVNNMPYKYAIQKDASYLCQIINADTNSLIIFCLSIAQNIIINILKFVLPCYVLVQANMSFILISFLAIVCYLVLYFLFRRKIYVYALDFKERQNAFFTSLLEQFENMRFIRIHSLFQEFNKRYINKFRELFRTLINYSKLSYFFSSLDNIVSLITNITFLVVGGVMVCNKQLTIGSFTVLSTYFTMILASVQYFLNLGKQLQETLVSYNRMNEILEIPVEQDGDLCVSTVDTIILNSISFRYNQKEIFHDFSYNFNKGVIYGIIGDNGIGKSTLLNIILGLYTVENGNILYNNNRLDDLDKNKLRKYTIGLVQQETIVVDDTIAYNLIFRDAKFTEEEQEIVEELANFLDMRSISSNIEDFYDIIIENQRSLSGGEKQKIEIIRALVKRPSVLILDEPTSALDRESASNIMKILHQRKKDMMIIIVTHDENIKKQCDIIIDLNKFSDRMI